MTAPPTLDQMMERASLALAQRDYLSCEALCLTALVGARRAGDWGLYGRILLPLQESRRQRRMIAAEGAIRLGTSDLTGGVSQWLPRVGSGCIVLTRPLTVQQAGGLHDLARGRRLHVEVLYADNPTAAARWVLRSYHGPPVAVELAAPPTAWLDRWWVPGAPPPPPASSPSLTPADWFIDATEALGDAALATVTAAPGTAARIQALEECLAVFADHEMVHQRLAEAIARVPPERR